MQGRGFKSLKGCWASNCSLLQMGQWSVDWSVPEGQQQIQTRTHSRLYPVWKRMFEQDKAKTEDQHGLGTEHKKTVHTKT